MDDAVEYHDNPHIQPLMTTECTEMRGAQDAVMLVTAFEDAKLVQYKVRPADSHLSLIGGGKVLHRA